jgi:L-threonylcarbamoyladenylate synthase
MVQAKCGEEGVKELEKHLQSEASPKASEPMKTLILAADDDGISDEALLQAAQLLREGETVAFPTETVYGLGGNALIPSAIKKIFKAKGRPADNPLIVHIADREALGGLAREVTPLAEALMAAFWPGPLTLVMKKRPEVPSEVTGGLDTVAVRMPAHPIARRLIRLSGVPVAAPSANLSGRPSPTLCEDVIRDLSGRVACILCGTLSDIGLESTVVDVTGSEPVILRPGGITLEMIQAVVGSGRHDEAVDRKLVEGEAARSPGMKYTHYSPEAEVILFRGDPEAVSVEIHGQAKRYQLEGKRVGIMTFDEHAEAFLDCEVVLSLGSLSRPEQVAQNLFRTLRAFDDRHIDVVLSETVDDKGLGKAIMNRLIKAAGYRIVQVEKS